jgi:hypothetical protein
MALPPLLVLPDEKAYKAHWLENYVFLSPLITFDGIAVRFFAEVFDHAFFRESKPRSRVKDFLDFDRAKRMDWVAAVLRDGSVELYRRVMPNGKIRRIALVFSERYAVIVQLGGLGKPARFITAYVVHNDSALRNMRSNPPWG